MIQICLLYYVTSKSTYASLNFTKFMKVFKLLTIKI